MERIVDRFVDAVRHQDGAHRHESATQCFGQNHHIGLDIEVMRGKEAPGAKHAGLHFVQHQQRPITRAKLLGVMQIISGGKHDSAFRLHGLDKKCSVVLRSEFLPQRIEVTERNCGCVWEHGAELSAPERFAHQRKSAAGQPVKGAVAR